MRYTDYFVTVDSHIKPKNDEEKERLTELFYAAVKKFASATTLKALLLQEEEGKLRRAVLTNASVETGDRYGRVHLHFNISILHDTKLLLCRTAPDGRRTGINQVVAAFFTRELGLARSAYARVTLAGSSRAKNYAIKKGDSSVNDFRVRLRSGELK